MKVYKLTVTTIQGLCQKPIKNINKFSQDDRTVVFFPLVSEIIWVFKTAC